MLSGGVFLVRPCRALINERAGQERAGALHGQAGPSALPVLTSPCVVVPSPCRGGGWCNTPAFPSGFPLSEALGLLYIPVLELGCSQSMPLDLRFGKHSGITSSRHSLGPLARRTPLSSVCLSPDACRLFCSWKVWPAGIPASQPRSLEQPLGLMSSRIHQPKQRCL